MLTKESHSRLIANYESGFCQAQPQLQLRLVEFGLFSPDPATHPFTHPHRTVISKEVKHNTTPRLIQKLFRR